MSDPNNPNIEKRSTPQYALYQRENFWKTNTGEVPLFNTGRYPLLQQSMERQLTFPYRTWQARRTGQNEAHRRRMVRMRGLTLSRSPIDLPEQVLRLFQRRFILHSPCQPRSFLPSPHHSQAVGRHEPTRHDDHHLRP